jgi:hypothetical protein
VITPVPIAMLPIPVPLVLVVAPILMLIALVVTLGMAHQVTDRVRTGILAALFERFCTPARRVHFVTDAFLSQMLRSWARHPKSLLPRVARRLPCRLPVAEKARARFMYVNAQTPSWEMTNLLGSWGRTDRGDRQ